MSLNSESKHFNAYYDHILNDQKSTGTIAIIYDLIKDLSGRRGLGQEWDNIDGEIQDEIIDKWYEIINNSKLRI